MADEKKVVRHIVGHTRTLGTTVLLAAYLEKRYCGFGQFVCEYRTPSEDNGYWTGTILCIPFKQGDYGSLSVNQNEKMTNIVNECRAFTAGRGEIWA